MAKARKRIDITHRPEVLEIVREAQTANEPVVLRSDSEDVAILRVVKRSARPSSEDNAWPEADLSQLGEIEPYDWGEQGPPAVRPVRYEPGRGLVIADEEEPLDGK